MKFEVDSEVGNNWAITGFTPRGNRYIQGQFPLSLVYCNEPFILNQVDSDVRAAILWMSGVTPGEN